MGHFGKTPIRLSWICVVMPALVLNYFGQGALLIENPAAISNPFYPDGARVVALAAGGDRDRGHRHRLAGRDLRSVLGDHSGGEPRAVSARLRVEHSSAEYAGQIYVPTMNWILMVATIGLVLGFGSSAALAGAYGLAVSGAMTIVTPLTLSLIKSRTGEKSRWLRAGLSLLFVIDLAFLLANLTKLEDGGWLPLTSGFIIYWLMQTWARGRASVMARLLREQKPVRDFLDGLEARSAGARARYGHLHGRQGLGHPARAAQQHQVQSRHSRAGGAVDGGDPRAAAHARGEALTVTPVCEGIVRVVAHVRLHGEAEHPGDPAQRGSPWGALRARAHDLSS